MNATVSYDPKVIEAKWQERLDDLPAYKARDFDKKRKKKYVLVEFPYPSGAGLHVGHAFSFTATDVYARYLRMQGNNVLFPMGWDSFGLPTENYAIKTGIKPQEATRKNTAAFKKEMSRLGLSFDWTRELDTTNPIYYKWTQWIFIKLFEKGLAEKKEMPINWCPKDKIGLANEEVIDGKCERCGTVVEQRRVSQWVVKITEYAERLLSGLARTNFIEKVKTAQINWIGKKEGVRVRFSLEGDTVPAGRQGFFKDEPLEIFTTRLDTIYGVTFVVVSPELVKSWLDRGWRADEGVLEYVKTSLDKAEQLRLETEKEKTGLNTGLYAINPINQEKVAVYVADYVLGSVGTGAVMGVPAHDERDFSFSRKHDLPVRFVIAEKTGEGVVSSGEVFTEDGFLISSGRYNDLTSADARKEIFADLEAKKLIKKEVSYHLRDWIFSRQHYWGEPIPMVFCEKDGWVPVPPDQLPVKLPEVEKYQPTDTGESPLANIEEFVRTTCPRCGEKARRETDTMPNWAGSDWYFLRFIDPMNELALADMDKMKYWMPVDVYVGGDEHNTLHLLYSRFIYQFLWDLGVVPKEYPEPYDRRLSHGLILGPDGAKMSKSRGNVISPDVVTDKYGADALRTYLMFIGPFDATMAWNERALVGVSRFLSRFYDLVSSRASISDVQTGKEARQIINRLVRGVGEDINSFKFNTAVAKLMEALNGIGGGKVSHEDLGKMVLVLAPIAPFIAEELWSQLGFEFSIHAQDWPTYDEKLAELEEVVVAVQVNGKTRGTVSFSRQDSEIRDRVVKMVLEDERYNKWIQGKKYNVIFVPERLINFVLE